LRDVFNFFKENKLTGDESIELVKAVKGEPRFTIEETHNKLKLLPKKEKIKKEPIELVVEESKRLVKILEKLEEVKFSKKSAESLSISLLYVQKKIKESLKFLGNISK